MTKKHTLLSLTLVLLIATNPWQEAECVSSQKWQLGTEGGEENILSCWNPSPRPRRPGLCFQGGCAGLLICGDSSSLCSPVPSPYLCPQVNCVILLISGMHNSQASNRPGHPVINTFNPKNMCSVPWAAKPRKLNFLWVGNPQVKSWVVSKSSNRSLVFDLSPNLFSQ